MIKIVADKDLPFLDKAFDYSEEIELLKLPYDQITNSNLKNADALISRSVTKINEELVSDTNLKLIFSLTSGGISCTPPMGDIIIGVAAPI